MVHANYMDALLSATDSAPGAGKSIPEDLVGSNHLHMPLNRLCDGRYVGQ